MILIHYSDLIFPGKKTPSQIWVDEKLGLLGTWKWMKALLYPTRLALLYLSLNVELLELDLFHCIKIPKSKTLNHKDIVLLNLFIS